MKSINTIIMNEGSGKSCHPGPLLDRDETECFCEPIEENRDNLKEVRLYVIVETHRPVERLGYDTFNGRYLM